MLENLLETPLRPPLGFHGWRENAGPFPGSRTATTVRQGPAAATAKPRNGTRLAPGAVVAGRYRIAAVLGRGGMGEVYRADDLKLHQTVALKCLVPERASDPAEQDGLRREVCLARAIAHPNVCRVFDLVEAGGESLLAMELLDGEDLARLLARRGRLPVEEAIGIARQIAAGLAAIHDGGLVHCDVKPANVRIDGRGRVRILDFGVAVVAGEPSAGRRAGTLAYMAPEQRECGEVSVRTDLYALGLVFYEMVTGQAVAAEGVEPGAALLEEVDGRIRAVLARCLAADPALRPSALEVWEALGAYPPAPIPISNVRSLPSSTSSSATSWPSGSSIRSR